MELSNWSFTSWFISHHDHIPCLKGLQCLTQFFLLVLQQDLQGEDDEAKLLLARAQDCRITHFIIASGNITKIFMSNTGTCRDWTQQKRQFPPWTWWEMVLCQKQGKGTLILQTSHTSLHLVLSLRSSFSATCVEAVCSTPSVSLGQALCLQGIRLLLNSEGCPCFLGSMWWLCAGVFGGCWVRI